MANIDYSSNRIDTDVTNFNRRLSSADTDVQLALETLDDFGDYAGIYAYSVADEITISDVGIANKVQIDTFTTNGVARGATPDYTNAHITVTKTGDYQINCNLSADSVVGTDARFGFSVFKNNGATQLVNLHAHEDYPAGGSFGKSLTMTGHATLTANDTIEVWVWNEDNTTNIVIDDINLNIKQL